MEIFKNINFNDRDTKRRYSDFTPEQIKTSAITSVGINLQTVIAVQKSKRCCIHNSHNAPDNNPKVVLKNNLLFFYCPYCSQLHSVKVANHSSLPKIDYCKIPKDAWLWNENFITPSFNHCLHTFSSTGMCDVYIQAGVIYKTTEENLINLYLRDKNKLNNAMNNFWQLYPSRKSYNSDNNVAIFDIQLQKYAKEHSYDAMRYNILPETYPYVLPMLPVDKWPVKINGLLK
jgi:hypothetical protein